MSDAPDYTPPKVWTWNKENGGAFANINRPIAGATHDKELPVGKHPLQLYSLATPNGVKVTIMLEELLALGHTGAEYDAWLIRIGEGDQFGSGFVGGQSELQDPGADGPERADADPGVRVRRDPDPSRREVRRVPADRAGGARRDAVLAVLADGQRALSRRRVRPFLRLCAVQDRICDRPLRDGGEAAARRARPPAGRERVSRGRRAIPIADIAILPWYGALAKGLAYDAAEFLQVQEYKNVQRWTDHDRRAPGGDARTDGQPGDGRAFRASCASGMTRAIS